MSKKASGYIWGVILILAGILMLLAQQNVIRLSWEMIWPLAMLVLAIIFHVQFFLNRNNPGILVPGGILLVYGCLFLYNQYTSWDAMDVLWPIFIIGPGFGLMEMKLFSGGKQGSWVPVIILFSIGTFFLIRDAIGHEIALAAALIVAGGVIVLASLFRKNKKKEYDYNVNVVNVKKEASGDTVVDIEENK